MYYIFGIQICIIKQPKFSSFNGRLPINSYLNYLNLLWIYTQFGYNLHTCGKSENKMSVFICLEFIDSFDHIFGRPFTNQIFFFQDDQTHIESLLSRSRMSNENQMFVPSKKESSVRRKTGLVKPWPSERSGTSSTYTDKKSSFWRGQQRTWRFNKLIFLE